MRYEVHSTEDGAEVYDTRNREVTAAFPTLKSDDNHNGDTATRRAMRYMARLILAENSP